MKKCLGCGSENADSAVFCSTCGMRLEDAAADEPKTNSQINKNQTTNETKKTIKVIKAYSALPFVGFGLALAAFVVGCMAQLLPSICLAIAAFVVSIIGAQSKYKLYGLAIAGIPIAVVTVFVALIAWGLTLDNDNNQSTISGGSTQTSTPEESTIDLSDLSDLSDLIDALDPPKSDSKGDTSEESSKDTLHFEIVGEYTYIDSIHTTHYIKVVTAKKDMTIYEEVVAKDDQGQVVGTMSDSVSLCAGTTGVLDISDFSVDRELDRDSLTFEYEYSESLSPIFSPKNKSFQVETYNVSGNYIYLTVTQTDDASIIFPKVQILFFKDGDLVDYDYTYASLSGKGSSDICQEWIYGVNYDDIQIYTAGY